MCIIYDQYAQYEDRKMTKIEKSAKIQLAYFLLLSLKIILWHHPLRDVLLLLFHQGMQLILHLYISTSSHNNL